MPTKKRRLPAEPGMSTKPILRAALPVALLAGLLALGAAYAGAEISGAGNVRVAVSGKLSPHTLPRSGTAPVSVSVGGKITTTDGTEPPQLHKLTIEINRHGRIDSTGLPTCKIGKIQTASSTLALHICGRALVGRGTFLGTITLPGAAPYPIEGKLLVFNGIEGGKHVLLGHVFSFHPFDTSFVIPFEIKSAGKGTYGTTLNANLAKSLGAQRNLTGIEMTLSRRYSFHGEHRSYVSAGCPAPKGSKLAAYSLARTTFAFANGLSVKTTLTRSCRARG